MDEAVLLANMDDLERRLVDAENEIVEFEAKVTKSNELVELIESMDARVLGYPQSVSHDQWKEVVAKAGEVS